MDKSLARILDANFNRGREALRVMEDYARFVLDDGAVSGQLKNARHELRGILEGLGCEELLAGRNTAGDVGTGLSSEGEMTRPDAEAVLVAACKRASESLRVLEEFVKTIQPDTAQRIEQLRYKCYEWELVLVGRGRAREKLGRMRLYVIISERLCKKGPLEVAEDVLAGGADVLQLREKEISGSDYLAMASEMAQLCHAHDKLFIVNDRADIALASGADGVHLGQDDLTVAAARKVLPGGMIVGISTHGIEQARKAFADGADYIGVGPVFATGTKPTARPVGLEYVSQAAKEIDLPQAVIGGINLENLSEVAAAGARAVAVCSAIISVDDPKGITREFVRQLSLGN